MLSVQPEVEQPAPIQLLSQDQLKAHAAALAGTHIVAPDPRRGRPLLPRLDESAARLEEAYQFLSTAARADPQTFASEDWLRDNYHVVQDQVREIRQDLPRKYYLELPKLATGQFTGYPRVFVVARELIVHTAARLDLETVVDFVGAYQRVEALSIGEVWAVPIMLRLGLVEELRRLADGVVLARESREQAREWQARVADDRDEVDVDDLLRRQVQTAGRLSPAFVAELLQWLRDQPTSAGPAWQALQRRLQAQEDTPEEMLRLEHQREAADQLAIGNVITSMRLLSAVDWALFFERVSLVEQILREDPAGAYAEMDFSTRDRYRHSVEELSKGARQPEIAVARRTVDLALQAQRTDPRADRTHHVGYYLISRGRLRLEQDMQYRAGIRVRMARFAFKHPATGYLGMLAGAIAITVLSLLAYASQRGATGKELWLVGILALLPVSELAISLLNAMITSQVPPRQAPKLALRGGIPEHTRTMVVIPAIIDSEARIRTLLEDQEVRFLANRDPHLHFALLTDFPDADEPSRPEDPELVAFAERATQELNDRHGAGRFFLFHRERRWNERDGRWMGWERKRGKLTEFNRLLRGATDTSFIVCHGDLSILPSIKYVITLDSDTQLPIDAGRRLVGTLSHPLNRPRLDSRLQRVTEGYGVLQPRIGVNVVSANRTAFAQVFSGHVGIDPYTTAVSDIYQDLFHEGSYVGKGIYDVDAFDAALAGRVPDNSLLSHDLFEGFYARAGLCTDIHLVDDYPAHYLAFAAREHRWVRGDWQIMRWLWRTVPNAQGQPVPNMLPVMSRWKILDNLRRSLLPPAIVALLAAGWTVLPGSALMWTILALLVLAFPAYVQVGRSLSSRVRGVPLGEHLRAERDNLLTSARQAFMSTALLAHQAVLMLDAIVRTLIRVLITRRRMLEWVSAEALAGFQAGFFVVFQRMWTAPALAIAIALLVAKIAPGRLLLAGPILALWFASPALAHETGRPLAHRRTTLNPLERAALRRVARKTWRFFEELVGPTDHWLVPDNYQEDRREVVAHRTSPTNIGLQLLSTLAAHDFGYLNFTSVLDRLEPTFATLVQMPRYRGHFYNWYDTRTLAPLLPAYISTVDSGNLAGYLITLKGGLADIVDAAPLLGGPFLQGIEDVIGLCEEELGRALSSPKVSTASVRGLKKELWGLRAQIGDAPTTLTAWRARLRQLADRLSAVAVLLHDIEEPLLEGTDTGIAAAAVAEAGYWLEHAAAAVANRQSDLDRLAPWAALLDQPVGRVSAPATVPTLASLVVWCDRARQELEGHEGAAPLRAAIELSRARAEELIDRAQRLGELADDLVEETEFGFLFNPERQLFSIGFRVTDGRLDDSYYDTLASEARLASYVAIAAGKIPQEHWFKLGRSLTPSGASRALLSWSASMFEYLMPLLVMRAYPGTLLDETGAAVVQRQIQYGARRGVPWGISESAYNAQDLDLNYQYRAFGVPGLGLKRGLSDDLVIAPYACILAAPIAPREALRNLERLAAEGMVGRFGYYEAIDYTADRLPKDHTAGIVLPTFMAHHQGMIVLALDNCLNDLPMQRHFHADPRVQAADLLLQERVPRLVPLKSPPIEKAEHVPSARLLAVPSVRRYVSAQTLSPRSQLLSNGSYSVMVTNAGGGYSRRQGVALTRWRQDITTDSWGSFCYIRDLATGRVWSTTHQPFGREPEDYEVTFASDRAVFRRKDEGIEVRTEIVVSPEDDAELRRVSLTNHTDRARDLELTSYSEVVLAPPDADLAHPAFGNLFIETMAVPERDALICVRRPRAGESRLCLFHVLSGRGRVGGATQFETDRARFVGRGRTLDRPLALTGTASLSNTVGPVLDPIVSLRQSIRLPAGVTARLAFTTGFAESEEAARQLIEKYHDRRAVARALALASTHSQIELRHFGLTVEDTIRFQRLASRLLHSDPRLRSADALSKNRRSQTELWKYGISGDFPMLLAILEGDTDAALFRELLKAHEYLRIKGLLFDLIVLNKEATSYLQELQRELERLIESGPEQAWLDRPGGVFLRRADLIPLEDQVLLEAAASVVMHGPTGRLHEQLTRPQVPFEPVPSLEGPSDTEEEPAGFLRAALRSLAPRAGQPENDLTTAASDARPAGPSERLRKSVFRRTEPSAPPHDAGWNPRAVIDSIIRPSNPAGRSPITPKTTLEPPPSGIAQSHPGLEMFNSVGGFGPDGREYVINVHENVRRITPAPWANVVANPISGFAATESGPGYTWSQNSHHNRLTPWHNDPVSDPPGEAIFIRDEETGTFWSATPAPAGQGQPYQVRHGQGYTSYEHVRENLASQLLVFAPLHDSVKVFRLNIRNNSSGPRQCSVTFYVDWVLGDHRSRTSLHIVTSEDPATHAVLAHNAFRQQFSDRIAFIDLHPGAEVTITGDRAEFIGRNGTLGRPAALERESLSGRTGATFDPCGAIQVKLELGPSEEREVVGLLGDAPDTAGARMLIGRYRTPGAAADAQSEVQHFWQDLLDTLQVRTPDRALDLMLNRWLLYQTLSCRIWGRSGFYQSSGAFGFRDQLQDVLALLASAPSIARDHLLRAASHQFVEGDVQHWWHEPGGEGVRTRISDDRLWLAYATLQYVAATGDETVLDEPVPFLQGRLLSPGEDEAYERASVSWQEATLFEHCTRAVALNLETGTHGLPLMGTGDWNDGMNLVGRNGRGESVWLGWFLVSMLSPLADLAEARGDAERADEYRRHTVALTEALDRAWDGSWYRRAYFDDGTPLGSAENRECQIDAIAQAWAVISGAARPERARQAMDSVEARLVRPEDKLILLLTPPFDQMVPSPGYIKGYLPGVRENGGQYTHAALWTVLAFVRLGDGDRAMQLLSLINPINHTRTADQIERYRAEPYVVAADVYSRPPHTGRGGWTWYTGSAGWMYRIGMEAILGITLRRGALHVDPCIPRSWPGFEVVYKRPNTEYHIRVENPEGVNRGVSRIEIDGVEQTGGTIPLVPDGAAHQVRVVLGNVAPAQDAVQQTPHRGAEL